MVKYYSKLKVKVSHSYEKHVKTSIYSIASKISEFKCCTTLGYLSVSIFCHFVIPLHYILDFLLTAFIWLSLVPSYFSDYMLHQSQMSAH